MTAISYVPCQLIQRMTAFVFWFPCLPLSSSLVDWLCFNLFMRSFCLLFITFSVYTEIKNTAVSGDHV